MSSGSPAELTQYVSLLSAFCVQVNDKGKIEQHPHFTTSASGVDYSDITQDGIRGVCMKKSVKIGETVK